jgi:hypothetical protein
VPLGPLTPPFKRKRCLCPSGNPLPHSRQTWQTFSGHSRACSTSQKGPHFACLWSSMWQGSSVCSRRLAILVGTCPIDCITFM